MGGTRSGKNNGPGGRDKIKPKRGGPRHFTVHPRDLYAAPTEERCNSDDDSDQTDCAGSESEQIAAGFNVINISCDDQEQRGHQDSTSDEELEEESQISKPKSKASVSSANPNRPTPNAKPNAGPPPPSSKSNEPRELTRREREAIEKERARQHFLKMKEKEDAARLAIIKKEREEAAAQAAALKRAKEEAAIRRR